MTHAKAATMQADSLDRYKMLLANATGVLGGVLRDETFETIEKAGDPQRNPRRIYHTLEHFREISNASNVKLLEDMDSFRGEFNNLGIGHLFEIVSAVMVRVGAHHDIVYHVDRDYLPARLLRDERYRILPPQSVDAPSSDYVVTSAEPNGEAGMVLDMARTLFDVMPRDFLTQFTGKNEFLSAVYAGLQGLQEGIAPKYLLAEMMMIEATRPFEPQDRFQRLRARFEAANRLLPAAEQMDIEESEAFLMGAVQLANVDVLDFSLDFNAFLKGSVNLLHEAGRTIITAEDYFIQAVGREAFFLNLLEKIRHKDAAVFHALELSAYAQRCFPPRGALEICEKRAEENIHKDILMSRALKISAALAMAVEAAHGEGNHEGIQERLKRNQMHILAGYPAMQDISMLETAMALRDCSSRIPLLALASFLLGHVNEAEMIRLSARIGYQFSAYQERFAAAFATRRTAGEILEWLRERDEFRPLELMVSQALGYGDASVL